MPYTRRQVRFLESSGSPLTATQKAKMNRELHENPALGHNQKGSEAMKKSPAGHMREMRIEVHHGPKKEVTGYTVHHHMMPHPATKSGAFMEHESHEHPFSANDHKAMKAHVNEHLDAMKGSMAHESDAEAAADASEEVD